MSSEGTNENGVKSALQFEPLPIYVTQSLYSIRSLGLTSTPNHNRKTSKASFVKNNKTELGMPLFTLASDIGVFATNVMNLKKNVLEQISKLENM